jgi:hypothetical protein
MAPPLPARLRLKGLSALLQISAVDARSLAAREPGLLAFRLAELRARMDFLIERLGVGLVLFSGLRVCLGWTSGFGLFGLNQIPAGRRCRTRGAQRNRVCKAR